MCCFHVDLRICGLLRIFCVTLKHVLCLIASRFAWNQFFLSPVNSLERRLVPFCLRPSINLCDYNRTVAILLFGLRSRYMPRIYRRWRHDKTLHQKWSGWSCKNLVYTLYTAHDVPSDVWYFKDETGPNRYWAICAIVAATAVYNST